MKRMIDNGFGYTYKGRLVMPLPYSENIARSFETEISGTEVYLVPEWPSCVEYLNLWYGDAWTASEDVLIFDNGGIHREWDVLHEDGKIKAILVARALWRHMQTTWTNPVSGPLTRSMLPQDAEKATWDDEWSQDFQNFHGSEND